MRKIILLSLLALIGASAADKTSAQKASDVMGCYYADIIYKPGDKHRVQESITDSVTHKVTMQEAEPEIWQECMESKDTNSKISPWFYWKTLANKN